MVYGLWSNHLPIHCSDYLLRWLYVWCYLVRDTVWQVSLVQISSGFYECRNRYGRRPIMCVSFILMTLAGFLCTFGPQSKFGNWPSYLIFVAARFLLACSTRGISESGFVLGSEMGKPFSCLLNSRRLDVFLRENSSCTKKASHGWSRHELFLHVRWIFPCFPGLFYSNLATLNTHYYIIYHSLLFLLLVSRLLSIYSMYRELTLWPSLILVCCQKVHDGLWAKIALIKPRKFFDGL